MKAVLILICFSAFQLYAQTNTKAYKDIQKTLQDVGGAGNGGGEAAMIISKYLNLRAQERGIKFKKPYQMVVDHYFFCSDSANPCLVTGRYYPNDRIILIDLENWIKLKDAERIAELDQWIDQMKDE